MFVKRRDTENCQACWLNCKDSEGRARKAMHGVAEVELAFIASSVCKYLHKKRLVRRYTQGNNESN